MIDEESVVLFNAVDLGNHPKLNRLGSLFAFGK